MIIIHKVGEFIGELFPRYKASGYNEDVLKEELTQYYTYRVYRPIVDIKDGFVTINIDTQRIENEVEEYKAVVRLCEQGQYGKAKPRLQSLIKQNPSNSEYHRILGQIYSDEGDQEIAIDALIDALRWNPKNIYALTMMGNIIAKFKNDIDTAMKYFNQVIELNPEDHIAINNLGANLLQQGKIEQAKGYFEKALKINPDYANTHYALALIAEMQGNGSEAFQKSLLALKRCSAKDTLYKQAYNLAITTAKNIIDSDIGMKILRSFLHKLEFEGDRKIEVIEDDSLSTIAKIELAENYNRENHVIRYKPNYPAKEHLMMHELVHIQFVIEARKENLNQAFVTIQKHKNDFITAHQAWIKRMVKIGMTEESVSKVIVDLFVGLNRQIYNVPIDLFIEDFLFNLYPDLRPYQFLSLFNIIREGIEATTSKNIVALMPKDVLKSSKIYNIIGALQYKDLYGIDLIKEFQAEPNELKTAQTLYNEYFEYKDDRGAGEEYKLIQNWANDLQLGGNFELICEHELHKKHADIDTLIESIEKDPYGLEGDQTIKQKNQEKFDKSQAQIGINMAIVWYMVDALKYFQNMPKEEIKKIAYEIALTGTQGIKPDQQGYKIGGIPDKLFSGYHLLAYYYTSWSLTAPEVVDSLNLPYKDEYELAKKIYKPSM
ncbi:MAG: tetratricopeptide repeat protein [Bacteroidetes bacterium]|nr:tetratricopeptide repeat protein [Bacteroidota bacterium]